MKSEKTFSLRDIAIQAPPNDPKNANRINVDEVWRLNLEVRPDGFGNDSIPVSQRFSDIDDLIDYLVSVKHADSINEASGTVPECATDGPDALLLRPARRSEWQRWNMPADAAYNLKSLRVYWCGLLPEFGRNHDGSYDFDDLRHPGWQHLAADMVWEMAGAFKHRFTLDAMPLPSLGWFSRVLAQCMPNGMATYGQLDIMHKTQCRPWRRWFETHGKGGGDIDDYIADGISPQIVPVIADDDIDMPVDMPVFDMMQPAFARLQVKGLLWLDIKPAEKSDHPVLAQPVVDVAFGLPSGMMGRPAGTSTVARPTDIVYRQSTAAASWAEAYEAIHDADATGSFSELREKYPGLSD